MVVLLDQSEYISALDLPVLEHVTEVAEVIIGETYVRTKMY